MYIPKRYGQSRIEGCPFCGKQSISKNAQGVAVCIAHKNMKLDSLKCLCGSFLDIVTGKWGAYCRCVKCGNVNLKRALEMNPQLQKPAAAPSASTVLPKQAPSEKKKEIVIRSDELHLYY